MLCFLLGIYYGCVLGFLSATCYRHWLSLYEPRAFIHEEGDIEKLPTIWRRAGGP